MNWNTNVAKGLAAIDLLAAALSSHAQSANIGVDSANQGKDLISTVFDNNASGIAEFNKLNANTCKLDLSPTVAKIMSVDKVGQLHRFANENAIGADVLKPYCDAIARLNTKAHAFDNIAVKANIKDAELDRAFTAMEVAGLDAGVALGHLAVSATDTALKGTDVQRAQLANSLGVSVDRLPQLKENAVQLLNESIRDRDSSKTYQDFEHSI